MCLLVQFKVVAQSYCSSSRLFVCSTKWKLMVCWFVLKLWGTYVHRWKRKILWNYYHANCLFLKHTYPFSFALEPNTNDTANHIWSYQVYGSSYWQCGTLVGMVFIAIHNECHNTRIHTFIGPWLHTKATLYHVARVVSADSIQSNTLHRGRPDLVHSKEAIASQE